MAPLHVKDLGFTEVYVPKDAEPVVDIIFIHGLQGNAYRTWTDKTPATSKPLEESVPASSLKTDIRQWFRKSSHKLKNARETGKNKGKRDVKDGHTIAVFWPETLLPSYCPEARILVYGYDTRVIRRGLAVNKNHLYSHGKDFLYDLCRHRPAGRPLLFLAHSLGGIVVKEALAIADEHHDEPEIMDIVTSTTAIVFMGTPHRGSEDMASWGERGRKVASALLIDSNSSVLHSLGLDNADLERCHDKFIRLWGKHNFRVKTFQEGRPLYGVKLGPLSEKIVPHLSSLIGDPKEHAETIDADHLGMCRFWGHDDPNFQKVGAELKKFYAFNSRDVRGENANWYEYYEQRKRIERLRLALGFSHMDSRRQAIQQPLAGSCLWITEFDKFKSWEHGQDRSGLLWIRGKPGSGKSTLLKHTVSYLTAKKSSPHDVVATFYFHSAGMNDLQRNTGGLFRSLLFQLFQSPAFSVEAEALGRAHFDELEHSGNIEWETHELQNTFYNCFTKARPNATRIIIDALDECEDGARDMLRYFWSLTVAARVAEARLSVCFSSRAELTATNPLNGLLPICVEIRPENHNDLDIAAYVASNLSLGNPGEDASHSMTSIKNIILEKSSGIFLWVVLVVNILQADWDDGRDIEYLRNRLHQVPPRLNELYIDMIRDVDPAERIELLHILQWVLFAGRPLLVTEWHHVMAFIKDPNLKSLKRWKVSKNFTQSDEQLVKWIKKRARGFLELKDRKTQEAGFHRTSDADFSLRAEAGSFESGQHFEVIHETVREFFISEIGCTLLDPTIRNSRGSGHLFILHLLVKYGFLEEMESFRVKYRSKSSSTDSFTIPSDSVSLESRQSTHGHVFHPQISTALNHTSHRRTSTAVSETSFGSSASAGARAIGSAAVELDWLSFNGSRKSVESLASKSSGEQLDIERPYQPEMSHYEVIEEIPALLHYFQNMFSFHAVAAEQNEADCRMILEELNTPYSRGWLECREDMRDGATLLYYAAERNLNSWVRWICGEGGQSPNVQGGRLKYPLIIAAAYGNYDVIEYLLGCGASRLSRDGTGAIALHYAATLRTPRALDTVRLLLRKQPEDRMWPLCHGINDQRNEREFTPLHLACRLGSREVVRELLNIGSSCCLRDKLGRTPFHIAARRSSSKIMAELLNISSSYLEVKDKKGRTALHLAVFRSTQRVVKQLINHDAPLNIADSQGNTPLHLACSRNPMQISICKLLIDAGCDQNTLNKASMTAKDVASRNGFEELVRLFT